MRTREFLVTVVGTGLVVFLVGCATPKYQQPPPLTQEDIISMSRAGKADPEIIQEIKTRRTYYRLSAKDVIHLHENGVSTPVIDYMLETYLEAVKAEASSYYHGYYWYPYNGYWYWGPPSVVIIHHR